MALSRKFLAALGIDADKIDQIISAHSETVSALQEEADKLKADADKYATVRQELDALKAATKGKDYDALKKEYDDYKTATEAAKAKAAKETAYKAALKDANLTDKGVEKALKYADWDKIEVDEDGKLKDAKEHVKAAREEWAEYVSKSTTHGANTATPPGNGSGKTRLSKEEIYKTDERGRFLLDATARQAALAELAEND